MLALCNPVDSSPPRLPCPWDSPGKSTGVGCHFLFQCTKVKSESEVTQSCPTLHNPRTAAYQAPLSMGFSRQEYWSGVPSPSLSEFSRNLYKYSRLAPNLRSSDSKERTRHLYFYMFLDDPNMQSRLTASALEALRVSLPL